MGSINVNNLTFAYRNQQKVYPVFDGLDLDIGCGEFVCLIGPSGCGKSTLLNILAGLLDVEQSCVSVGGKPLLGPGHGSAVVFQHYSLFPWMTAYNNVAFGIRQMRRGLPRKEIQRIAEENLKRVSMWDFKDNYPYQLSGGMQQRVAIARALATDADILFLDEPFGALDERMRKELQKLLRNLWRSAGQRKTVLFVTHDIEEAVSLADRVLFMRNGAIEADLRMTGDRGGDQDKLRSLFYQSQESVSHAVLH